MVRQNRYGGVGDRDAWAQHKQSQIGARDGHFAGFIMDGNCLGFLINAAMFDI